MTVHNFDDFFVSADDISKKCSLSAEAVKTTLDNLPVQTKDTDDSQTLYRIEGKYMHMPSLLLMLKEK